RTFEFGGSVRQQYAQVGCGRDEGARLVGDDLQVVLDGVVGGLGPDGLVQLTEAQPLERVGLQRGNDLSEPRDEAGRAREQEVAREDRDGVAPDDVGGGDAAAQVSFVHDVVVVQR